MRARDVAVANRDWAKMNEITKRLAKLPVPVPTVVGGLLVVAKHWPTDAEIKEAK